VVSALPSDSLPSLEPSGALRRAPTSPVEVGRHHQLRVVYFIASHVNPDQIVRLVRACRSGSPNSRVLLHHDYTDSYLDPQTVRGFGNVDLLPPDGRVRWGLFDTCAVILRCMRWLLDHHEFDWVVYLSGQDYPIRPVAAIENDLAHASHDGYLQAKSIRDIDWHAGPARYLYQYFKVPRLRGWRTLRYWANRHETARLAEGKLPLVCIARRQGSGFRLGLRAFHSPFRDGVRCVKGSSWWTLNRRCVNYMVARAEQYPALIRYYRRVGFAPNESFFQTILLSNPELRLVSVPPRDRPPRPADEHRPSGGAGLR
jgi:hypothetical protein